MLQTEPMVIGMLVSARELVIIECSEIVSGRHLENVS